MGLDEFNIKYGLKFNFLQYNSIIAAIKKYTNNLSITPKRDEILFQPALNIIMTTKSGPSLWKLVNYVFVEDEHHGKLGIPSPPSR